MSKYIRTKDGISKLDDDWALFCKDYASNKQVDTIEELCDEYVVDNWEEKNKPILCKYVKERNALYYCDENGINWLYIPDLLKMKIVIYASIWVDALLKPVAKMNEKGELELL